MGNETDSRSGPADELARAHERIRTLEAEVRDLRARPAPADAQAHLDLAMNVGRMAWWEWDVTTGEVYGSAGKAGLLGYAPSEGPFDVHWWVAAIHPDERERACSIMESVVAGDTPFYELDYRLRRKDGGWQWFHDRGCVTRSDSDGNAVTVGGVIRDITERVRIDQALRESERRFREVIERAPFGVHRYRLESDGRLVLEGGNPSGDAILHLDHESLRGRTIEQAFPALGQTGIPNLYRAIARGERDAERFEVPYRDSRIRGTFEVYAFQASPGSVVVMFDDVSERARMEEALRRRTADLQAAQQVAGLGSWSYDLRRRRVFWSPQMYVILGHDERLGPPGLRALRKRLSNTARVAWERAVRRLLEGGGFELEFRFTVGGRERTLHVLGRAERDARGVARVYGTLRDVTVRKQTEDALVESRRFLAAVFDAIEEGICVSDPDLCIRQTNRTVREWLRDHLPLEGRRSCEVLHPGCDSPPPCPGERAIRSGRPEHGELKVGSPDGPRWLSVRAFPMWDGAGHIQGVVEVVRDITEAKIAAERREQLEARMLRAQKYESLGTLAGGVAHDFNNLLMTILGGAELAAEDVGPGHRSYPSLKIIADAAVRAGDLSQQIMLYAGQRRRQLETVSLLELLRDLQPVFRAALPRRHPVELRGDPACPHIRVDVQQMRQLFMNLMVNASEALGDRDAPITLRTGCGLFDAGYLVGSSVNGEPVEGTYVYAEVTDAGDGMAPEVVRRIFDPFYTTREQGRGLGLAAVGGIVRAHRGAIVVNSRPGEGTTIRVLFPSAEDENPRANATGPESAQA